MKADIEMINKRDMILFGEKYDPSRGQYRGFSKLTGDQIKELIELGALDPDEAQNESPTTEMFLDFIEGHPDYYAHGYAIGPDRSDCRVTIEGIAKDAPADSIDEIVDFVNLCRYADDFCIGDSMYAWWD